MSSSSEYLTVQTDRAGFLLAKGHELRAVRYDGRSCTFVFPPDAANDAEAFERGGHISGQLYAQAQRTLKNLIARAKREHEGGRA